MSLIDTTTEPRELERHAHKNSVHLHTEIEDGGPGMPQHFLTCPNRHCRAPQMVRATAPPRGVFGGRCSLCKTLLEA